MRPMMCGINNIYMNAMLDASSHKFTTYLPGGATLFDFVVIHNGSKLCTGAVSHDNTQGAATGWWPAASCIKARVQSLPSTIACCLANFL